MIEETKICSVCGKELPLDKFPKSEKGKDGHRTYCRMCQTEKYKKYKHKKKIQAVQILTDDILQCNNCGIVDIRVLVFDHVNNDGYKERNKDGKRIGQTIKICNYIINNPEEAKKKYQVLCHNCNHIKQLKYYDTLVENGGRFSGPKNKYT